MNRLFLVFLLAVILSSCEDYSDEQQLSSAGEIDELLIVVAEDQVQTEFSDTLVYYFSQLYPGLPQAEPRFTVRIKTIQQFLNAGDLLKKYRNVIFAGALNSNNTVSQLINEKLGSDLIAKAKTDPTFFYASQNDVYAVPQLVIYLFAPTRQELVERLDANHDRLFNLIIRNENEKIKRELFTDGTDQQIMDRIEEKFDISIRIPGPYYQKVEEENFLWVAKDQLFRDQRGEVVKEVKQNILIAEFPMDSINLTDMRSDTIERFDVQAYPFILRDQIGIQHVHGNTEANFMITDSRFPLYQEVITIDGHPVLESRGLWRLQDQFMGGPFFNYIIKDEANNRILMVDAFVYGAGSAKRPLIRQLEAIVSTLELDASEAQ